eukprot:TRINITY_DN2572_c2_g1_i2.p1 TRINITY_DN2572_c2_g1~~TRINITY_DN2572_c2_g1_i2.p1  ORF type:complete len:753 (+),score=240.61 TRINITY_DN2572_c2_g1_i2:41-2260(+)
MLLAVAALLYAAGGAGVLRASGPSGGRRRIDLGRARPMMLHSTPPHTGSREAQRRRDVATHLLFRHAPAKGLMQGMARRLRAGACGGALLLPATAPRRKLLWGCCGQAWWPGAKGTMPPAYMRWTYPLLAAVDDEIAPRDWAHGQRRRSYSIWDVSSQAEGALFYSVSRAPGTVEVAAVGSSPHLFRVAAGGAVLAAKLLKGAAAAGRRALPEVVIAEVSGGSEHTELVTVLQRHFDVYLVLCREWAVPAASDLSVSGGCVADMSQHPRQRQDLLDRFTLRLFEGHRGFGSALRAGGGSALVSSLPDTGSFLGGDSGNDLGSVVVVAVPRRWEWARAPTGPPPSPPPPPRAGAVCCRRDWAAVCPDGWELWQRADVVAVSRGRPGEAKCSMAQHPLPHNKSARPALAAVTCVPPAAYAGPCRHDPHAPQVPGCSAQSRMDWSAACGVQWPCAEWADHWYDCVPHCGVAARAATPAAPAPAACDGFLHVVQQLPPPAAGLPFGRRLELVSALLCTLRHPSVRRVHLLQEEELVEGRTVSELLAALIGGPPAPVDVDPCRKAVLSSVGRRIRYSDALRYAERLSGQPVLLTNADCSVADSWSRESVDAALGKAAAAVALTRYEDTACVPLGPAQRGVCDCRSSAGGCIDSYLVRPPLPASVLPNVSFRFGGVWGGENVFIENLRAAGVGISNRCGVLRMAHHHCSQARTTQSARDMMAERTPLGPFWWRLALPVAEGMREW